MTVPSLTTITLSTIYTKSCYQNVNCSLTEILATGLVQHSLQLTAGSGLMKNRVEVLTDNELTSQGQSRTEILRLYWQVGETDTLHDRLLNVALRRNQYLLTARPRWTLQTQHMLSKHQVSSYMSKSFFTVCFGTKILLFATGICICC